MRVAFLIAALLGATPAFAQGPLPLEGFARGVEGRPPGVKAGTPLLVVCFLFDQWRGDLLERYRPAFGKDGLARILDGGAVFTDCTIPYSTTWTGPGHATWLSGASPAVHGIVGNEWYDRALGRLVTCVEDPRYADVGVSTPGESASPRFMRAQTVADALKLATLGRGKVVALSDKARGAVLPAGRKPDGAYWMDGASGLYQTSSYYAAAPPAWLVALNAARTEVLRAARGTSWTPRASLGAGVWSGTIADPDDTFPHPLILPKFVPGGDGTEPPSAAPSVRLIQHPLSQEGAFDLARGALEGEALGTDDVPDLLIVSVSVTDRVGHLFGPESPEALDLASRTDSLMADFMKRLDAQVGRGRWALTITADHGVTPGRDVSRRFASAPFDSVGNLDDKVVVAFVARVLGAAGKTVTRSVNDGHVVFDPAQLKALGLTIEQAARTVADSAYASPWFQSGFTAEEVRFGRSGDPTLARLAAGWFPARCGDVELVPRTNVSYESSRRIRAGHGGPMRDQRLVPFILYGEGVRPGVYRTPVSSYDIAATTARLLGIEPPVQCEGTSRDEALR